MESIVALVDAVLFSDSSTVEAVAVGGEEEMVDEAVEAAAPAGFARADGEEKKEVMEALAFGFFAVDVAMSAALRLRGVVILWHECTVQ